VFPALNVHIPGARHKDAAAIRERAPARMPSRSIVKPAGTATTPSKSAMPKEVLIIASRLKDTSGPLGNEHVRTSDGCLSDYVRVVCDRAIDNARAEGRKTVLDRDFDFSNASFS